MIKRIRKIIKFLKPTKWDFKNPKKNNVILYDNTGLGLKNYLDTNKIFILNTRGEQIYFFLFFKSIIKNGYNWNFQKYLYEIIKTVNPSVILTNVDNNKNFWQLRKKFKNLKTIFIQNGNRHTYITDIFSQLGENDRDNYFVDKMFVFNDLIGKEYSKYIKGDITTIGSLNNNSIKRSQKKGKGILFISEWSMPRTTNEIYGYYHPEKFIFPLLSKFAYKNKMELNVLGRTFKFLPRDDGSKEKSFFSKLSENKNWNYIPILKPGKESYKIIDESEIVVSISSTLGYEAFGRGKKTAFISIRGFFLDEIHKKIHRFAWPSDLPENGPFWTNFANKKDFLRIMDYLFSVSDEDWFKNVEQYSPKCMYYDEGNLKFLKEMKNLQVPIRSQ